jgi:ABC-type uncharacterized transport system fused permease/ATPase subunit
MLTPIIIAAILVIVATAGYLLRWNLRRAWYVLLSGDEHPDWDKLGADYFSAPRERGRFMQRKAAKLASAPTDCK